MKINFYWATIYSLSVRQKNMWRFFIIGWLCAVCSLHAIKFSPQLKWYSLESTNFIFHYHEGIETRVYQLKDIAEKYHKSLSLRLAWLPQKKVHVVITDNTDISNGMALPVPYNHIYMFVVRPELASTLAYYKNWLKILFIHEYTHILNLDSATGFSKVIRTIFGRYPFGGFMNLANPIWILEGIAVHIESTEKRGRNYNPYVDMIIRSDVYHKTLPSLTELTYFTGWQWPRHSYGYLYGGRFIQFLENKYGHASFTKVILEQANNVWPFQTTKNIKNTWGVSLTSLWREWQKALQKSERKFIQSIKSKGLSIHTILSSSSSRTGLPRFSPNTNNLYYVENDSTDWSRLVKLSINDHYIKILSKMKVHNKIPTKLIKRKQKIADLNFPSSLSVTENEAIYFTDLEYHKNFSLYRDIFYLSKHQINKKFNFSWPWRDVGKQISHGQRILAVDFSNTKKKLVWIQIKHDQYSMLLGDPLTQSKKILIQDTDVYLQDVRWAPKGDTIVFSYKDKGNTGIGLLNLATKKVIKLIENRHNNLQPTWHPTKQRILFTSDQNGVYNIYELNLKTRYIHQITNLIGGALYPDINYKADLLVFASYEKNGFNIALMPYPKKYFSSSKVSKVSSKPFTVLVLDQQMPYKPPNTKSASSYNALSTLKPTYWGPKSIFYTNLNGFYYTLIITHSTDVIRKHGYQVLFDHFVTQKRFGVLASYTYFGLWPDIKVTYTNNDIWLSQTYRNTILAFRQSAYVDIILPFIQYKIKQNIIWRVGYTRRSVYRRNDNISTLDLANSKNINTFNKLVQSLSNIQLFYQFNNTYPYTLVRKRGRSFLLAGGILGKFPELQYFSHWYQTQYKEYINFFFRNHVIELGANFGIYLHQGRQVAQFQSIPVRGYTSHYSASRMMLASIEYFLPLLEWKSFGLYDFFPIIITDIYLSAFFDYGNLWDTISEFGMGKTSIGTELHGRFLAISAIPLRLSIGYAYSFQQAQLSEKYIGRFYFSFQGVSLDNVLNQPGGNFQSSKSNS